MRCRACNMILAPEDLKRPAPDDEYCSECRFQSEREFNVDDIVRYDHAEISGILLDGSTLYIDQGVLDEPEEEENNENNP